RHVHLRQPAEEGEQRVPENRKDQRRFTAPPVGGGACAHPTQHAADQGDTAERTRERLAHGEASLDVHEQKRENREIERVEHPRHVRGRYRAPLWWCDVLIPRPWRSERGRRRA